MKIIYPFKIQWNGRTGKLVVINKGQTMQKHRCHLECWLVEHHRLNRNLYYDLIKNKQEKFLMWRLFYVLQHCGMPCVLPWCLYSIQDQLPVTGVCTRRNLSTPVATASRHAKLPTTSLHALSYFLFSVCRGILGTFWLPYVYSYDNQQWAFINMFNHVLLFLTSMFWSLWWPSWGHAITRKSYKYLCRNVW
jgi:hypothetical protein